MYTHTYIYTYLSQYICVCNVLFFAPTFYRRVHHTRHILPPSEIDLELCWAVLQAQEGNTYFTELAERAEYGNYVHSLYGDVTILLPYIVMLVI